MRWEGSEYHMGRSDKATRRISKGLGAGKIRAPSGRAIYSRMVEIL